jgi:hypothetical protein
MNTGWMAARVGLCVGALAFGGCTSTLNLPATELPKLSTQNVYASDDWVEVNTVEGDSQRIIGEIQTIHVQTPKGAMPVYQPFTARINGPHLEVWGQTGPRGYPLAENPTVKVEYDDAKKRRNALGGTLIGIGLPVMAGGGGLIYLGAQLWNSGDLLGPLLGVFPILFGVAGVGGGIGMVVPGIVVLATDPKKDKGNSAALQPKLQIRPGGVDLTMQF